jgi:hypothetical protein
VIRLIQFCKVASNRLVKNFAFFLSAVAEEARGAAAANGAVECIINALKAGSWNAVLCANAVVALASLSASCGAFYAWQFLRPVTFFWGVSSDTSLVFFITMTASS